MERVAVIGNSGGGKSTLSRRLSQQFGLPCFEVDAFLWHPGWVLNSTEAYENEHQRIIASDRWVLDGLGRLETIADRLTRATDIVLIDMPLWMHFWLAAERQIAWATGSIDSPPACAEKMPPTEALFQTIWDVDQNWMPDIRRLVLAEEARGKNVFRLTTVDELAQFTGA
ncbi:MAG: adenylate kinase [Parvibaculaceae bacterium]